MIAALESGAIKAQTEEEGKIAVVVSTHRAATSVGYALAPIVVALNPTFRFQGGEPHQKFTICQFTGEYVDMNMAAAELAALEPGWGGSPTIIGSPQGISSKLSPDEVVAIVSKHLKK
jgi:invasion protein IalB